MKRLVSAILILAAAVGLSACGEDSQTWRQKLRVVVSTPNGDVAGEAVSEGFIKVLSGAERLGSGNVVGGRITQGEATVVDLGQGRYVFALLDGTSDASWYLPFYTFIPNFPVVDANDITKTYVDAAHQFVKIKGPRDVPKRKMPLLVTFSDIANPRSVKIVRPEDLAATFGAGYALKSITLEITNEDVTRGRVGKVLDWLGNYKGKYLDGGNTTNPQNKNLDNKIGDANFSLGN